MRKLITKVVALALCLVMIACWIPHFEIPAFAASEYPNTHVNTGNMAADIVAVAVSQAGYCEGSLSGNPAYAGSNNYQKYGQWYDANVDNIGVEYAAWCAAFVSWCANQAGVPSSIVYYHAYCPYGVNWFRDQGRFQYAASRGGSYIPQPGDIVYFAPAGSSTSSHVGIVRYAADGYVYTVEGNTSGQNGEVNDGGGVFLKSYSLSYSRLYGYGTPAYADNSGKNPIGQIDEVTALGPGKIRVRGWTLDEDALWTPLETHVYIGGGPGDANAEGHIITADLYREDIAAAYPNAGGYHGFDVVLNTGKSGWQAVNVFGINIGGGDNTLLTNSGWIVDVPADTENPVITDVQVSNVSAFGYTVTCTVSDNVAIGKVTMPTWTEAWEQDDIIWGEATVSGNQATYNVSFSSHNFEYGTYNTHIYAYDLAGNYVSYPIVVDVPAVLTDAPVSGTVGENTYFIASVMNKNYVVDISAASTENNANAQLWFTIGTAKNQMWQISDPDGDGYYTIISLNSGKALEAAAAGTTDGTNVQQYEVNGTDAQLWKLEEYGDGIFRIVNKNSGLALDLLGGTLTSGQNIQLYTANDSWAQMWYLIPADLTGPDISNVEFSEISSEGFRVTCTLTDVSGIQKVQFPAWTKYNGIDDQKWYDATVTGNTATCYISISNHNYEPGDYEVHIYADDTLGNSYAIVGGEVSVPNRIGNAPVNGKLDNGTYFITSAQNQNFVVDVEGISTDNSANIYLWETMGVNTNQMWQISDADGDGYYTVVAVHSGKYMDVAGGIAASGTNVHQYEATNSAAQLWQIVPNDDGTYCFYSMCGGFALDLNFGLVSNGTNISIHDVNGSVAQKWYLIPAKLSADTSHIHTYLTSVVTEPTCTEAGYTTHTCANCGDSYTDNNVSALGHSYVDGKCTVCGEADPNYNPVVVPSFSVLSKTLNLEGEVKYNMIFMASNTNSVTEMGLITFLSNPSDVSIENADYVIPGAISASGMYMVGSQGIPAKNLGDTLYMVIYAKLTDGSYAYSSVVPYSAKDYAYAQLGNSSITGNQRKLLVAMLNYGAEAQLAFGYNTDNLINADLAAMEIPEMVTYSNDLLDGCVSADDAKTGNFPTGGFHMNSATVSLEGALAINYLLMPANTPANGMKVYYWTADTYNSASKLTIDNADGTLDTIQSSGMYMATYNGLAASQMGDTVYVAAVYENGGNTYTTGVISYSLAKYLTATADGTGTQKNLAAATVIYGYYANIEFPNVFDR